MDASSASWMRIPRDYHEQQRLQLEHRLFASSVRSNSVISDDQSSFNLEEEDGNQDDNMDGKRSLQLQYSSSESSMEYPRNLQTKADDSYLSNLVHRQPRESDTRSTWAHHASAITFRTGLRGTRTNRSGDFCNGVSDVSIDYDPDRPLDALLRQASELSILQDSPRDAPRSEFTTRAQGLAKQMMANENPPSHPGSAKKVGNGSFTAANMTIKPTHKSLSELAKTASTPLKPAAPATTRLFPAYGQTNAAGKVQLPDVTGITSAVATPLKGEASFRRIPDPKPSFTFASRPYRQAQPTTSTSSANKPTTSTKQPAPDPVPDPTIALNTLAHRLHQIERESLTSRRRVNELERELDLCKSAVEAERSRMGELSIRHAHTTANTSTGGRRRNANGRDVSELDVAALDTSFRETQRRYREAVGEEKELEALVKALHAHLRRTSATVESHKQIINELRAEAAESHAQQHRQHGPSSSTALPSAATEIWEEIGRIKSDVEILWGDVDRLRGVVEGGLGLRRAREGGVITRDGGDVFSGTIVRGEELSGFRRDDDGNPEEEELHEQASRELEQERQRQYSQELEEEEVPREQRREWGAPVLSAVLEEDEPPSTRASVRTPLTPTTAANHPPVSASRRFIQDDELERVRAEVEERRSLRSASMSGSDKSISKAGGTSVMGNGTHPRTLDNGGRASPVPATVVPSSTARLPTAMRNSLQQHTPPRPLTPDSEGELQRGAERRPTRPTEKTQQSEIDRLDRQQTHENERQRVASPSSSSALPQIRGERLERLFYAAPEHNSRTCGVCHRRRRAGHGHTGSSSSPTAPKPIPVSIGAGVSVDVGADGDIKFGEGDERRITEIAAQSGVPPQTILARVLRELEDDFTHYKSIYVELADQYKAMDAASDMGKRNLLANHLREVIDVLEQKGDQIASLYDLLHFEDKPLAPSHRHHKHHKHEHTHNRRTRLS